MRVLQKQTDKHFQTGGSAPCAPVLDPPLEFKIMVQMKEGAPSQGR